MTFTLHEHNKSDGRKLWLYSIGSRNYEVTNDLPPVDTVSKPIKRWHPLRGEYVYYNPNRNQRSLNPPPEYNPLAPVAKDGFPGEIPVTDFEIAIFQNRWPGLSDADLGIEDQAYGKCEVVVYSTSSTGSLADLSLSRISLLLSALGDRAEKILKDPKINFVLPFENRGSFVGTTLPHPHGQIYAFQTVPKTIASQMENANAKMFEDLIDDLDPGFIVAENEDAIAFCPEFSRYPYEVWVLPKQHHSNPKLMSDRQLTNYSEILQKIVSIYDRIFEEPAPYVMWHALPERGKEADWRYHIQFWPLQRGKGKMKYLASVEQITGAFLVDVMPKDAAKAMKAMVT